MNSISILTTNNIDVLDDILLNFEGKITKNQFMTEFDDYQQESILQCLANGAITFENNTFHIKPSIGMTLWAYHHSVFGGNFAC